ncbi:MAG: hypothetical protein GPJ10_00050 [Microcystis aeruginosa L211-07]|nr:hypothetical protein [Microcystis aeruginosa L211-07]
MADNLGKRSVKGWLLGKMLSRVCGKKFFVGLGVSYQLSVISYQLEEDREMGE